jgi:alkanesulfonate monooxygenase SsuD/methylene tetrahydromethanopterin reductase-like flavin-dependent oxidoreductase (luciferase family)
VFASPQECRERREAIAAACREQGREPIPLSVMTRLEGEPPEITDLLNEYRDAGVERIMLQHLHHDDLDTVERVGREVIPAVS